MKMQNKKLIIQIVTMAVILVTLICSFFSLAWYSSNMKVSHTGMSISISTPGPLVISDDPAKLSTISLASVNDGNPVFVAKVTDDRLFSPASHDSDYSTYPSGLKYIQNNEIIDIGTGIKKSSTESIVYSDAVNVTDKIYYVDYDIYIASYSNELTGIKLVASISSAKRESDGELTEITSGSLMATSVDIYADSVSSGNYKGTLNVAGYAISNDYPGAFSSGNTRTKVYLVGSDSAAGTIPKSSESSLHYVLRFYFDGALQSGDGQTYIYTADLDCSKIIIGLDFSTVGGND